jgi:major membrane immunogen (membrane-anchored lipoprotein)
MKKVLALALTAMLVLALSACGSTKTTEDTTTTTTQAATTQETTTAAATTTYKDGTYKAEYDNFDSHGWKSTVSLTISGDKITDVVFDYVNKDGGLKSKDAAYEDQMKKVNKIGPAEYTVQLADALKSSQDITKVDSLTGATTSSNNFKTLATAALEKAKAGDTTTAVLPLPKE